MITRKKIFEAVTNNKLNMIELDTIKRALVQINEEKWNNVESAIDHYLHTKKELDIKILPQTDPTFIEDLRYFLNLHYDDPKFSQEDRNVMKIMLDKVED